MAAKKSAGKTSGEIQEVAEKVVKIKQQRPSKSDQMKVQTTPQENSKYLKFVLESYNMPAIDFDDDKQVSDRINWYFEHCISSGLKPTVAGACNALGVDRTTFYRWGTGELRGKTSDRSNIVKKFKAALMELWEIYASEGKVNALVYFFTMKNHFGYTDKQEVVVTPNNPLGDGQDEKQLEEKYQDSVIIDAEAQEVE